MPATTYYELLEVPHDADASVVRKSFMRLAREWHPDKAPEGERDHYEGRFSRITEAYEVLSDPTQRDRYDRERQYRARRPVTVNREPWAPHTTTVGEDDPFDWRRVRWESDPRTAATESPFASSFGTRTIRNANPWLSFSVIAIVMGLIAIIMTIALGISGLARLSSLFRPAPRGR